MSDHRMKELSQKSYSELVEWILVLESLNANKLDEMNNLRQQLAEAKAKIAELENGLLSLGEQKEILDYIECKVNKRQPNVDNLPAWLFDLVTAQQQLAEAKAKIAELEASQWTPQPAPPEVEK